MTRLQEPTTSTANTMREFHSFLRSGTALLRQCRGKQWPLGLAVLDTRAFARASWGQPRPDGELTRMVVRRLAAVAGEHGLAGQTGRNEYALLLPGLNKRQALHLVGQQLDDLLAETTWGELEPAAPAATPYRAAEIAADARSLEAWLDDLRAQLPCAGDDGESPAARGQWEAPADNLPATILMPLAAR